MKRAMSCAFLLVTMMATDALGRQGKELPPWVGVWTGTVGKSKVVACFEYRGKLSTSASYYYLRHLTPIPLLVDIDSEKREVHETGQVSATWFLDSISAKSMTGHWTKKGETASLPLRLTLVPGSRGGIYDRTDNKVYNGVCASDFFNAKLEAPPPTKIESSFEANGRRYKILSATSAGYELKWFQLDETGEVADAINKALRANIPETKEQWGELFQCRRILLSQTGESGHAEETNAFSLSTSRLLIASISHVKHCDHISMWSDPYLLLSLKTGNEVSLWGWLKDWHTCFGPGGCLSESLGKLVRSKKADPKPDPSCPPDDGNTPYEVDLSFDPDGFQFTSKPDRHNSDCEAKHLVPFQDMAPFLTDEGKTELESIKAELKKAALKNAEQRP